MTNRFSRPGAWYVIECMGDVRRSLDTAMRAVIDAKTNVSDRRLYRELEAVRKMLERAEYESTRIMESQED